MMLEMRQGHNIRHDLSHAIISIHHISPDLLITIPGLCFFNSVRLYNIYLANNIFVLIILDILLALITVNIFEKTNQLYLLT